MRKLVIMAAAVVVAASVCYAQNDTADTGRASVLEPPRMPDDYQQLIFGETSMEIKKSAEEENARQAQAAQAAVQLDRKVPEAAQGADDGKQNDAPAADRAAATAKNEGDFGKVKEGEVLEYAFLLKNTGKSVLNLKEIHTSCGCTTAEAAKKVLAPGEETTIKVRTDTKGESGQIKQNVYVNTDDIDNPVRVFIIKAEVVKFR